MKATTSVTASRAPRRIIQACGAAAFVLVFGFALVGVISEARQLMQEGVGSFVADAALRAAFGALIGLLSAAPYAILYRAARQPGPPAFFAAVSVLTFAAQLWLTGQALFFAQSSTAPIAILFIPFYLCVPALILWLAAAVIRRMRPASPP